MILRGSSESSGLSFRFHELQNVSDSDWALHVPDQVSLIGLFTGDEGDFDLGDTSSWSGSSEKLSDSGFDGLWFHWLLLFWNNYNLFI